MTVLPCNVSGLEPPAELPAKEEVPAAKRSSGYCRPTDGPEPDWMDRFMKQISQRDFDAAREVLRSAVAQGLNKSIAEQYGKVLEEFLQQRDEVDNPKKVEPNFGVCALRAMDNVTGRGLIVPGYVNWGDELWRQRPIAYIQSPGSKKCVQVCSACLVPVGTLASQLAYMGLPIPEGAMEIEVVKGAAPPVQCPGGCGEVFCSEACCAWAREFHPHAVLCGERLSTDAASALKALEELSNDPDNEQEHILLLAHHIAAALLARKSGDELPAVMHRYVEQFTGYCFSKPWDTLADEDDKDGDTPSYRRDLLDKAAGHLRQIFAGHELAAPFLETQVISSMMGTYELVNMCISIPHPLNTRCKEIVELVQGPSLAKLHELQKGVDEDSDEDDEDDDDDDEDEGNDKETATEKLVDTQKLPKEDAPEAASGGAALDSCDALLQDAEALLQKAAAGYPKPASDKCDAPKLAMEASTPPKDAKDAEATALAAAVQSSLFAFVVGTSLCEALSFMNHSCLPNARIDFDTSATPDNTSGPGLWVFSAARRPLIPGDEVQMCYVPSVIGKPVEVRQRRMKRFGFECRCRCCTTDEMLKAEGDVIR